jgi:hypothetical protein
MCKHAAAPGHASVVDDGQALETTSVRATLP